MVILITGARSGFGRGAAREIASRGHTVWAGLRDPATGAALAEATEGLDVRPLALDVTSPEQVAEAMARIERESGRLDGLVNNAGVALGGFLEQLDDDEMAHLFAVNVLGVHRTTRAALPLLRAARGSVVMVSSMSGLSALPGLGAYAASKFALEGMAEAWRHELAPFGVRVTLIEPGPYRTDILARNRAVGRHVHDPASPYAPFVRRVDALAEQVQARAADPAEVARAIADLLEAPSPALRHPMGPGSRLRRAARALLPFRWWERALQSRLGRPEPEPPG